MPIIDQLPADEATIAAATFESLAQKQLLFRPGRPTNVAEEAAAALANLFAFESLKWLSTMLALL